MVEDDPEEARRLRELLQGGPRLRFSVTIRSRLDDALAHLAGGFTDIVFLDLALPDARGLETVRRVRAIAADVPIVVLADPNDEAVAAEALEAGAQDYLVKGPIVTNSMLRAIRYATLRQGARAMAAQTRQRERELKEAFLSHVSHELRTPLAAIYQFTTILRDGLAGEVNERQREYLDITLRNARDLKKQVDDLLDVTRAESGQLRVELRASSVAAVIGDVSAAFAAAAAAKALSLTAETPPGLPLVLADPSRVQQVLNSLVDNAIKFTPAGGRVEVRAEVFEHDPAFLRILVTDTGVGVSPEALGLVFDRLYQAGGDSDSSRTGLGLGLYLARELTLRHGGRIWVESEPGQGSTFSFTLPLVASPDDPR